MEDEDIKGGRSDLALAAFTYGVAGEIVVGTHHLLCMISAAERQAEVMETGTLEEANQAFFDAFDRTSAPLNNFADAMRDSAMSYLQSRSDTINLEHYHTAGTFAPVFAGGIGVAKFLEKNTTKIEKKGLDALKKRAKNRFPKDPKNLLPELPRDGKGRIYTSDRVRIRPEQHPMKQGEIFTARHHDIHYHVEMLRELGGVIGKTLSMSLKLSPPKYEPGQGTGFLPGEKFPGSWNYKENL